VGKSWGWCPGSEPDMQRLDLRVPLDRLAWPEGHQYRYGGEPLRKYEPPSRKTPRNSWP
jgi:hypothetical protein